MEQVIQALVSGILIGAVYALIATGLTLVFGVMDLVNFAHGELVMLGMYTAFWTSKWFSLNPYLSLPVVILVLAIIGAVLYRFLIIRVESKAHSMQILLTLGLSILIQNVAMMLWSPDYRTIEAGHASSVLSLMGISITVGRLIAFGGSVVFTTVLYLFLQFTDTGKMIRAVSQDRMASTLMGINGKAIYTLAFALGAVAAGVGGALVSAVYYIFPGVGNLFILPAFIIIVLGGLGNFWGAFWGGLIIGISESVGAVFIPPSLSPIIGYCIFICVLWLRPQGLFGVGSRV